MTTPELLYVRQQADDLGVKWHHKHKIETIQKNIDKFLEADRSAGLSGSNDLPEPLAEQPIRTAQQQRWLDTPQEPMSARDFTLSQRRKAKQLAGSLVHCKITCMNHEKRNWNGEFISVGSAKLGTFKKYIPFDGKPYHIPKIIYDMLVEKKCTHMQNGVDDRGVKSRVATQINEFNIEVLDPLTPAELEDLRVQQALAKGKVA